MIREITGRHVALMLAGFFGLMFAVNGAFVYFALSSFSGVSVENAYRRGLAYNDVLAAQESQNARNWQHSVDFTQTEDKKGEIFLRLTDGTDAEVRNVTVRATLRRPVVDSADSPVEFLYADGGFAADLIFAEKGQWDVVILIEGGGFDTPYWLEKRIWVK